MSDDECRRIADEYLKRLKDAVRKGENTRVCDILREAIEKLESKSCPIDLVSEFKKFYKNVCEVR